MLFGVRNCYIRNGSVSIYVTAASGYTQLGCRYIRNLALLTRIIGNSRSESSVSPVFYMVFPSYLRRRGVKVTRWGRDFDSLCGLFYDTFCWSVLSRSLGFMDQAVLSTIKLRLIFSDL